MVIEVADNGLGIDLKLHRNDLFKPFKQFHPTISGRGTGLYLVKLQTEKINGTISMESAENIGSRVILNFV